jgi:bacteriocin-like protein
MSNTDNNRVLSRSGARKLTEKELEQITGTAATVATALPTSPIAHPDTMFDQ